jgi:hypothetical protein
MVAPFIARLLGTSDEGAKPRTSVKPMRGLHSSMGQRGVEPRTSRLSGVHEANGSPAFCRVVSHGARDRTGLPSSSYRTTSSLNGEHSGEQCHAVTVGLPHSRCTMRTTVGIALPQFDASARGPNRTPGKNRHARHALMLLRRDTATQLCACVDSLGEFASYGSFRELIRRPDSKQRRSAT